MIIIFKFISKILSDTLYIAEFWLLHTQPIDPLNICSFSFNLYYSFTPLQKIKNWKKKTHGDTQKRLVQALVSRYHTFQYIYFFKKKYMSCFHHIHWREITILSHVSFCICNFFFKVVFLRNIYIFYFILYNI